MKNKAPNFLSREQIRDFKKISNARGLWVVTANWLAIIGSLSIAALWTNPLTILFALVVIGTRQLALAIIMHEASHKTLHSHLATNNFIGQWLGAAPIAQDLTAYRSHHLKHHGQTGTEQDPDLRLANGYPVSPASLRRKLLRDLSGITGIKALLGSLAMLAKFIVYNVSGAAPESYEPQRSISTKLKDAMIGLAPTVITNSLMFAACVWFGHAWLYLLWLVAYLTIYQAVLRIRSIAEHAMTADAEDALNNARTTYGRWWERLLFAPLNVNYHLEHHMLPTVPFSQLPRMHSALKKAGAFEQPAAVNADYGEVLKLASSA